MSGDLEAMIRTIVVSLVEFEQKVNIVVNEEVGIINCTIQCAPSDVGRLIGRNGTVAENIQQVVRAFDHLGPKQLKISVVSNDEIS